MLKADKSTMEVAEKGCHKDKRSGEQMLWDVKPEPLSMNTWQMQTKAKEKSYLSLSNCLRALSIKLLKHV